MVIKNKKMFLTHLLIVVVVVSVASIIFHKSSAVGGTWVNLGDAGFSAGTVEQTSLAIDSNLNQYVAFRDNAKAGKLTVMKYDQTLAVPKWTVLGKAGFSAGAVGGAANDYYFSLKIDSNDVPYVAYLDEKKGKSITVMKYDGKAWVTVGKAGFTSSNLTYVGFGIDSKNNLYVAYPDTAGGSNMTVMKYDTTIPTLKGSSTQWTIVGNPGFSGRGGSWYPSIAFDSKDTPYVGYLDVGSEATVMKYDALLSQWIAVGSPNFSPYGAWEIKLALDSNDVPYVYFNEDASMLNNDKASVMKYNGTSWVYVGKSISSGSAMNPSFVIDSRNNLYVSYSDAGNSFKSTVMKYDGSAWNTLGSAGFSNSNVSRTSIAVDSLDEVYIAFKDNEQVGKLTVMKYENSGKSCANDILSFNILGKYGEIYEDSKIINIVVPYGTDITALAPNILLSDYATVAPKSKAVNNFAKNKHYIVKGQNKNCVKIYQVNLTVNKWEEVGGAGFSAGEARYISTALDSYGVPYVAYSEDTGTTRDDMSVMKYDEANKKWANIGTKGFTPGEATESSIAIDPKSGNPYVSFVDGTKNLKLSVMMYDSNNGTWYNVGFPGFSGGQVQWTKMAFDSAGKPYVAYAEHNAGYTSLKVTVMKYNGKDWAIVGSGRFAGSDKLGEDVSYIDMTFDSNNIPYIVYVNGKDGKANVMKSNGKGWDFVGNQGFTPGQAETTTIAMGAGNTPYVAFKDGANGNKVSVMKYDAKTKTWVAVAKLGFSTTEAYDTSIKFYGGTPYVAFNSEYNSGAKATVMKLNGTNWIPIYNTDFSDGQTTRTSLVINKKGIPYVVYQDIANKYKVTMMRRP